MFQNFCIFVVFLFIIIDQSFADYQGGYKFFGHALVERPSRLRAGPRIVLLREVSLEAGTLLAFHCTFHQPLPADGTLFFQIWRRVINEAGTETYRLVAEQELRSATANHTARILPHIKELIPGQY